MFERVKNTNVKSPIKIDNGEIIGKSRLAVPINGVGTTLGEIELK